jgi:hypothetical protein
MKAQRTFGSRLRMLRLITSFSSRFFSAINACWNLQRHMHT